MSTDGSPAEARPLRVLHVGNIANNAYLLAKAQRERGIDAVVVSPRPPFIMGFPDWEEVSFTLHNQDRPHDITGSTVDGTEFTSPDWFMSGSWDAISTELAGFWRSEPRTSQPGGMRHALERRLDRSWPWIRKTLISVIPPSWKPRLASTFLYIARRRLANDQAIADAMALADIVHLYGPSADIADHAPTGTPVVALEHGTLRDFVWASTPASRAAANGYQRADRVILTNQDCLAPAQRLGIPRSRLLLSPHPSVSAPLHRARLLRADLLSGDARVMRTILIPARHTQPSAVDVGKGTDEILRCIASMAQEFTDVRFQLVDWGDFTTRSRQAIRRAGLDERVEWLPLLSRPLLQQYMARAHCVIDQLTIPAYGGITSDCLGIGVPVITAHDCDIDTAYFGCCAPVLPARDSEQAHVETVRVLQTTFDASDYFHESTAWYDHFLSSGVALNASLSAYAGLVGEDRLPALEAVPPLHDGPSTFSNHEQ